MKDYKTITREKVDADPGAARYMSETHLLEDWSDKLLDLVLNGPTLNGFKKDELRAMLRQTYAALKQYEQIGPMASPYMNDPSAIVARAFAELYPGIDYHAQFVPDLCDESGNRAFGLTIFPDDGSTPIVCISAEAPISAAPELLAHELAHVATPEDKDHGEAWKAAEKAIGDKYDELLNVMIPDDDPGVLVPHEVGDGGLLLMPTRANIPDPQRDDWKPTTCPICGAECWELRSTDRRLRPSPDFGPSVPTAACVAPPASDSSTPATKRRKKTMNENRNNSGTAGGIGFCGLLTIAFIILKLTGVISWSWLWVLAPIWIPTAIVLAVLLVVLIVVLVKEGVKQTEEKQRQKERSLGIDEQARHYGLERQPGETDLELKKRIAFLKQAERRAGNR
jgi:hypothetical protein